MKKILARLASVSVLFLTVGCDDPLRSRQAYDDSGEDGLRSWCREGIDLYQFVSDERLKKSPNYADMSVTLKILDESCGSLLSLFDVESQDADSIQSYESHVDISRQKIIRFVDSSRNDLFDPIPLPEYPFDNDCTWDIESVFPPDDVSYSLNEAIREEQNDLSDTCNMIQQGRLPDLGSIGRSQVRALLGHSWFDDEETETFARIESDREAAAAKRKADLAAAAAKRKADLAAARETAIKSATDRLNEISASLLNASIRAATVQRNGDECLMWPCWRALSRHLSHNFGMMPDGKSVLVLHDAKFLTSYELMSFRRGEFFLECRESTVHYSGDRTKQHEVRLSGCVRRYVEQEMQRCTTR